MTNDEMKRDARKNVDDVQGRIEQGPVQEQISDHSEVFDDMAEYEAADQLVDDSRKAARSRGWMWVAVAVALLLGAAICVLMIPDLTGSKTQNAIAMAKDKASDGIDKATDAIGRGMAVVSNEADTLVGKTKDAVSGAASATKAYATDAVNAVGTAAGNAADQASHALGTASAATDASAAQIEDEARRVIHGEFGNGAQRRQALGSHYAAVQHRVNELMHA